MNEIIKKETRYGTVTGSLLTNQEYTGTEAATKISHCRFPLDKSSVKRIRKSPSIRESSRQTTQWNTRRRRFFPTKRRPMTKTRRRNKSKPRPPALAKPTHGHHAERRSSSSFASCVTAPPPSGTIWHWAALGSPDFTTHRIPLADPHATNHGNRSELRRQLGRPQSNLCRATLPPNRNPEARDEWHE